MEKQRRDAEVVAERKKRQAADAKANRIQQAEHARKAHESSYERIFEKTDQVQYHSCSSITRTRDLRLVTSCACSTPLHSTPPLLRPPASPAGDTATRQSSVDRKLHSRLNNTQTNSVRVGR
jgi:hypothetical protein